MAILGIDDTDSQTAGMCTTWIATEIRERLPPETVEEVRLIRLNPAIEAKTRGNGAIAMRVAVDGSTARRIAEDVIDDHAIHDDPKTNPGLVVFDSVPRQPEPLVRLARDAIRREVSQRRANDAVVDASGKSSGWGSGRGIIGAAAAVGATLGDDRNLDPLFSDWTVEWLAYRRPEAWGTDRSVSVCPATTTESVTPPAVWDTVDPVTGAVTCVPHSPCPVLYGIRGDSPDAVRRVGQAIEAEPRDRTMLIKTNQGTDAHLQAGTIGELNDGQSYRVVGHVTSDPTTKEGGHVTVRIANEDESIPCLAFSPTGRFREYVRALVPGDRIIACGEFGRGALKLEKFALVDRSLTREATPQCPSCERSMESAGRNQGYRCRSCETHAPTRTRVPRSRSVDVGWYEVPPMARRHLAKPLTRATLALPVCSTIGQY